MSQTKAIDQGLGGIWAAVLAGGLGTRLRTVVSDRPKVLAPVLGKPYLHHLLSCLATQGVTKAIICTGYLASQVQEALGERQGTIDLQYSREENPLGTGGALRLALSYIDTPHALVANGDSWCHADLRSMYRRHLARRARATMLLARVPEANRYGAVHLARRGLISQFREKSLSSGQGWINAGIYFLAREVIAEIPAGGQVSLERDIFPALVGNGLYGFPGGREFLDIGTPESYSMAEEFCSREVPA